VGTSQSVGLLRDAVSFLERVYSPERALFPFSTSVRGDEYVNDYGSPQAIRYTINSLLGLREAARLANGLEVDEVSLLVDAFLERQYGRITSHADLGLLLVLLSNRLDGDQARDARQRLQEIVANGAAGNLDMQSLAWMLWGLTAAARAGAPTQPQADRLFRTIVGTRVNRESLLPRHSRRLHRSGLVSFGAIVYFLRAMHEYASLTGNADAEALFQGGVSRMIAIQGPSGEWPWLMSVRNGRPVEPYPVFAVHQDSMAMLFLLPALDAGLPCALEATERSLAWAFGRNELRTPMYSEAPFRAYRSIERTDALPRAARYGRALANDVLGRSGAITDGRRVRINQECRSYHLGWILYVWSAREALLEQVAGGVAVNPIDGRQASLLA